MSHATIPIEPITEAQPVRLPWSAWYHDGVHELKLPGHFSVDLLCSNDMPEWTQDQVDRALDEPVDSLPLERLAEGKKTACIVVDDLARPTRACQFLPKVLSQLDRGGIGPQDIFILVATGTHGSPTAQQIRWKLGEETADRYQVRVHSATDDLAESSVQYGGRPLRINRHFLDAELKLGIGCVLPHSFAGYSGGAKLVLPGLSDVSAAARSHKFVQMGLRGGQDPNENRFRLEIEELAERLGFGYSVCVVPGRDRATVGVFAGHPVAAHRKACHAAQQAFATPLKQTYDCLLLNAYPKDTDLIQSENVFVSIKHARAPVVHDAGVILITTAATEGLGRHGLFEPGGASHRAPRQKRGLGSRELWIYAPDQSEQTCRQMYWEGYPFYSSRDQLLAALGSRFPEKATVGVLPIAPMQQIVDQRESN